MQFGRAKCRIFPRRVNEILSIFPHLGRHELSANFYAPFADNQSGFYAVWPCGYSIGKFCREQQQPWLQASFKIDVHITELNFATFADDKDGWCWQYSLTRAVIGQLNAISVFIQFFQFLHPCNRRRQNLAWHSG